MPLQRYNVVEQFDFHHVVPEADGISIVFFSSEGCASCRHWHSVLQSLLRQRLDIRVFEVDATQEHALVQEFNVFHLPALFVYRDGDFYGELQVEGRLESLIGAIDKALTQQPQEPP